MLLEVHALFLVALSGSNRGAADIGKMRNPRSSICGGEHVLPQKPAAVTASQVCSPPAGKIRVFEDNFPEEEYRRLSPDPIVLSFASFRVEHTARPSNLLRAVVEKTQRSLFTWDLNPIKINDERAGKTTMRVAASPSLQATLTISPGFLVPPQFAVPPGFEFRLNRSRAPPIRSAATLPCATSDKGNRP